ncbi:hypothetical protein CerSpe_267810 [Prunus speciosa]
MEQIFSAKAFEAFETVHKQQVLLIFSGSWVAQAALLSFDDEKFSEHCRVGLHGLWQHCERGWKKGKSESANLDLLDVLLDYRSDRDDELKSLSRKNIKGMLTEMFVAGTETTSSTFEWGMAEILRKPDAYKKIVMELDQVVGKDRFVEESDISNLPYLPAAVKEVFWLHPAIPLLVPRSTNEACEVSWVKHRCERP